MAKEVNKKKPGKVASAKPTKVPESEVKPGLSAYVIAVSIMMRNWIERNALLAGGIALMVIALTGMLVANKISDRKVLTSDEMIVRVSSELGISGDANPAILDVTDETKAQSAQPFLEQAKNGDKGLLYYKSGKSVLFRPNENKIVRSGTFRAPDAKIFIRQGGHNETKVEEIKQQVVALTDVELVSQDYSTNRLNDKTVVVDLTDRYNEKAQEIAQKLGAQVVRLPKGESVPDADIMIIVGNQ